MAQKEYEGETEREPLALRERNAVGLPEEDAEVEAVPTAVEDVVAVILDVMDVDVKMEPETEGEGVRLIEFDVLHVGLGEPLTLPLGGERDTDALMLDVGVAELVSDGVVVLLREGEGLIVLEAVAVSVSVREGVKDADTVIVLVAV